MRCRPCKHFLIFIFSISPKFKNYCNDSLWKPHRRKSWKNTETEWPSIHNPSSLWKSSKVTVYRSVTVKSSKVLRPSRQAKPIHSKLALCPQTLWTKAAAVAAIQKIAKVIVSLKMWWSWSGSQISSNSSKKSRKLSSRLLPRCEQLAREACRCGIK